MRARESLLGLIDQSWQELMAAVDSVPADRVTEPGVLEGWSVKDLLGHVSTWDRLILRVLQREPGPRAEAVRDRDAYNVLQATRKSPLGIEEVMRELEATHAALRDMLESAPEAVFEESFEWREAIDDDTHRHYIEHAAHIRRWLAPG